MAFTVVGSVLRGIASYASYQVPQIIEFRDALPRNPTGKVLKRELV